MLIDQRARFQLNNKIFEGFLKEKEMSYSSPSLGEVCGLITSEANRLSRLEALNLGLLSTLKGLVEDLKHFQGMTLDTGAKAGLNVAFDALIDSLPIKFVRVNKGEETAVRAEITRLRGLIRLYFEGDWNT